VPEIEYRQIRAHLRWLGTPLAAKPRYRAPHAKVLDLHRQGLTQKRIAKLLKVDERTVRTRLMETPALDVPREPVAADLLAFRPHAYKPERPKLIQQGSTLARPSDPPQRARRIMEVVPTRPTIIRGHADSGFRTNDPWKTFVRPSFDAKDDRWRRGPHKVTL
jgi:hypothetical protein